MKEVESVLDHYDEEEFEGFENFIPPPPPAAATKETTSSPIKPTNDQKENVEAKSRFIINILIMIRFTY